jgi:hypothetical protein
MCAHPSLPSSLLAACSNHFVDVLEEGITEWARQQVAQTRPVSIDGGGGGGGHPYDYEDDHSSGSARGTCSAWRLHRFALLCCASAVLQSCSMLPACAAPLSRSCACLALRLPRPALRRCPARCPAGNHHYSQQLPFELVALEVALKEVVNAAGLQVKELESVALPALDALTKSVSRAGEQPAHLHPLSYCWLLATISCPPPCIPTCNHPACAPLPVLHPFSCCRLASQPAAPTRCAAPSCASPPSPACPRPPAGEHGQLGARAQGEDAAPAADHTLRDAAGGAGALPS